MGERQKTAGGRSRKPAGGPRTHGRLQRALDTAARRLIREALQATQGNVVRAAAWLGISRRGLWKRLSALAIDPERYRKLDR